jgi:hypothetical protein
VLEGLFMQDPSWSSDTVGKNYQDIKSSFFNKIDVSIELAAKKLRLPRQKVYKWGYFRKQSSRKIQKISSQLEVDYNRVVDEIFNFEKKEVPAKKREYKKNLHNRAIDKSCFESDFF